ncbi:hypothetical protein J6590_010361 [Homalodisca vitripennis]|nr:hypothetical protein J6590_010361 [Homalodisca vitripennis]
MATFKQFKVTRETVVQLWTKMGKAPSTNLQPHFVKVKLVTLPSVEAHDLGTTAQPFCQYIVYKAASLHPTHGIHGHESCSISKGARIQIELQCFAFFEFVLRLPLRCYCRVQENSNKKIHLDFDDPIMCRYPALKY